jgi:predicted site-specific integrase-resolvase
MRSERGQVDYLSSARAARILQVSKRTLLNWVNAGKIPTPEINPVNRYLLWTMSDIEAVRTALQEEK